MHGQMVMDILNVVYADSSNSSNTNSVTNFLNIVFHIFFQIDSLEDFNIVFELVFWIKEYYWKKNGDNKLLGKIVIGNLTNKMYKVALESSSPYGVNY